MHTHRSPFHCALFAINSSLSCVVVAAHECFATTLHPQRTSSPRAAPAHAHHVLTNHNRRLVLAAVTSPESPASKSIMSKFSLTIPFVRRATARHHQPLQCGEQRVRGTRSRVRCHIGLGDIAFHHRGRADARMQVADHLGVVRITNDAVR